MVHRSSDADRNPPEAIRRSSRQLTVETAYGAGFCYELNRRRLEQEGFTLAPEEPPEGTPDDADPAP